MSNLSKPRQFLQYNDLVFDGRESINSAPSETITTKYYTAKYLLKHGDYVAVQDNLLFDSHKLTVDLAIRTADWDISQVQSHVDYIKEQLVHSGKVWALDTGGTLVWAHAILDSYTPTYDWSWRDDGYILFSIELNLWEGIWHKADGKVTFLEPYDFCSFKNKVSSCFRNSDCDSCDLPSHIVDGFCQDCYDCCDLANAIPLCEARGNVECDFFDQCASHWRIVHNCNRGREIFGEERMLGEAFCDTCADNTFLFNFYADTVLDSTNNSITLFGSFEDPEIMINDTKVKLNGKYENTYLTISTDGTIKQYDSIHQLNCNEAKDIDYKNLEFCDDGFWTITKGNNTAYIKGITSDTICVFVDYERLTI